MRKEGPVEEVGLQDGMEVVWCARAYFLPGWAVVQAMPQEPLCADGGTGRHAWAAEEHDVCPGLAFWAWDSGGGDGVGRLKASGLW